MNAPVSPSAAIEAARSSPPMPEVPPRRPVRWVLLRVVPVVLLLLVLVLHDRPQVRCCPTDGRKQGKRQGKVRQVGHLVG